MRYTTSLLFLILLLTGIQVNAQQLPQIGMFSRVQLFYNPAYAGSGEGVRAALLHRHQWLSVSGAPSTQIFTVDALLGRNIGGGLLVSRDQLGKLVRYDVLANVSYRVYVNPESYFQGGLRAGMSMINMGDGLFQWDENDPNADGRNRQGVIPRIGAGLYYRSPVFYAGISAPDIVSMDTRKLFADNTGKSMIHRNYAALGGARIHLSEYLALVPTALLLYYPSRPLTASVNLGFDFNQTVLAGIGYRTANVLALYGMIGITTKLKIGYRHEIGTAPAGIGKFSTSEIMLGYGLN